MTRSAVGGAAAVLFAAVAHAWLLDAVVAYVDQEAILWSQVLQEVELRRLAGEPESLLAPRVVREALVRRRLLIREAEKMRLEVSEEDVAESVAGLEEHAGAAVLVERLQRLGLEREDLVQRARQLARVRRYLDLRRQMTFVPESRLRGFYTEQADVLGAEQLAEVRDRVRQYLAEKRYQKELDEWIDRQVEEGRVRLLPLPAGAGT